MRHATQSLDASEIVAPVNRPQYDTALGFLLAGVCPALFWTAVLSLASDSFGWHLNLAALGGVAFAIATFLGLVCGAIRALAQQV